MPTRNHEASLPEVRLAWPDDSMCAQTGSETFFPEVGNSVRDAKLACLGCGALQECLVYALENNKESGVWGGYSERERRELKHLTSLDEF